jgi:AcrR family transcriptional regulator
MPRDKTKSHEKIIEAAKKEFLEYGYADASLRRIAASAGIQVGGLYKHFASKDEMFEALVEPAIKDFYKLYHDIEKEYFDDTGATEWEAKSEVTRVMECIYGHFDEFRLLILRSQGTRYEDLKHEIALLEENATLRYLDELRRRGCKVRDLDDTEFHLLSTAYIEAFFQPLIHGLDRQKAMHYAKTLEEFYQPAWKTWLGI